MQHFFAFSSFSNITAPQNQKVSSHWLYSLTYTTSSSSALAYQPVWGKGAEGFLEAGNMPNRPTLTPSYPAQRPGPGPTSQHRAKTTNCNYLRMCFSFEVFFPKQWGKNQDRRFENIPHKPNVDMVKDVGTEYKIQRGVCMCVHACMCEREGEKGRNTERSLLNAHSSF